MKYNRVRNGVRPYFFSVLALTACGTSGVATAPAFDPQLARAVHESATHAAVARPGARVCRQMQVGISERDWVRGVVEEADAGNIRVRIDDPGRFAHTINGVSATRGALVHDRSTAWLLCLRGSRAARSSKNQQ
jgi:hypothetical protein